MMASRASAVVDDELLVRRLHGLIDASVMPAITSTNTNASTIMIATLQGCPFLHDFPNAMSTKYFVFVDRGTTPLIEARIAKIVMVGSLAMFAFIVTFDNITDYDTNFTFVRHVFTMDTIFPGSTLIYRRVASPVLWNF